jgi:uncharacterized UPF0160 family protein
MGIAQNRHDTAKWKKKEHFAAKCGIPKCPICHPHKFIGGNHKGRVKMKYKQIGKDDFSTGLY